MTRTRFHLLALALYTAIFILWFLPVLLSGKYLAPGDGLIEYLPNYLSARTLWEPALGTGYPAAADPLTFTWYLPAILLSWIPGSYNAFAISGYVLAAWFTYLLTYTLTQNRLAAWVSGILYGFSGFLMGHLGHPSIVHTAAWIPAVLLGLERIRSAHDFKWFAFGCFATGQLILSGHPQIIVYGLTFAAVYAAVRGFSTGATWAYYRRAALMVLFGFGLGAVLLLPLIEFTRLGVRQNVTFEFFNVARFPLRLLSLLLFPFLYGGEENSLYEDHFNVELTEQDEFLGFLTLALLSFAFVRKKHALDGKQNALTYLLLVAGVVSLLCSFGGDTIVGRTLYLIPPFNQFRCQGRWLVVFQLATALLAGIGIKRLLTELSLKRVALQTGALFLFEIGLAAAISIGQGAQLQRIAASRGVQNVSFALTQPMFLLPLVTALLAALAIFFMHRHRGGAISVFTLSLVALADMAQFGMYSSWRYYSPSPAGLDAPPTAALVRKSGGRSVAVRGFLSKPSELGPNRSKLWGVASLNKYGSLAVERYNNLLQMDPGGTLYAEWWKSENRSLDILGARHILLPDADIGELDRFEGIPVPAEDMGEDLGQSGSRQLGNEVRFAVDPVKRFTALAVISYLRESAQITGGTTVAEIRLHAPVEPDVIIPVLAGRDTAEFAADCPAVRKTMSHPPATIFRQVPQYGGPSCLGTFYFAKWPLDSTRHFSSIEFKWLAPAGGIQIAKAILWNHQTGAIQAFTPADIQGSRFQLLARSQFARTYENSRVMPRAWLVSDVRRLNPEEVKRTIQTSILPDGSIFDPSRTALTEASTQIRSTSLDPGAVVTWTTSENTSVELRTRSKEPALLVLADLNYPGWTASVDGQAAKIIPTNYVQRGVELAAGDHVVRFRFRPGSLWLGIGIGIASLLALAAYILIGRRLSLAAASTG